jgi:hypothetical protein
VRHVLPVADVIVVEVSSTARHPLEAGAGAGDAASAEGEGAEGAPAAGENEALFVSATTPA